MPRTTGAPTAASPGPRSESGRPIAARRDLCVAEFGVQHEQDAEVVGVGGRGQPERPPEPGDPVQSLAAELALGAEVDRGVRGRGQHEHAGVLGRGGRGQPEARRDRARRRWRATRHAPSARSSSIAARLRRSRRSPGCSRWLASRTGRCWRDLEQLAGGFERAHQPDRAAQPARGVGAGRPGQFQPVPGRSRGPCRCPPRCRRAGRRAWPGVPALPDASSASRRSGRGGHRR